MYAVQDTSLDHLQNFNTNSSNQNILYSFSFYSRHDNFLKIVWVGMLPKMPFLYVCLITSLKICKVSLAE